MPNKFAVALLVALNLVLICFLAGLLFAAQAAFAQTQATSIRVAWEFFPLSRSSNSGWYNLWRAAKSGDFCASSTDFVWIGHVQQTFDALGNPIAPVFVDAKPLIGGACYAVSFVQTPSGTPTSVESERSDPIAVSFPQ